MKHFVKIEFKEKIAIMQGRAQVLGSRLFSTSNRALIREIIRKEDGKTVTFEGVKKPSPRSKNLIDQKFLNSSSCQAKTECHPLCKFDKVHEIKHTGL